MFAEHCVAERQRVGRGGGAAEVDEDRIFPPPTKHEDNVQHQPLP